MLIRLEVSGDDTIPADRVFVRTYHLTIQDMTYCRMEFSRSLFFEDGHSAGGFLVSVYQKYLVHHGAMYRFSFLNTGEIWKIQIVCYPFRLVLFPPALPCHPVRAVAAPPAQIRQDSYLTLALGVRIKTLFCDLPFLRKFIDDIYGFEGQLGFLEPGMSGEEIRALLGEPTSATAEELTYMVRERRGALMDARWEMTVRLSLNQDTLSQFETEWLTTRVLPPQRGSIDWILETVLEPYLTGESSMSDEDLSCMFDRFVDLAPQTSSPAWDRLCQAMFSLSQWGYQDARVLSVVRSRFLESRLDFGAALWVLHAYDPEGSQELFLQKVYQLLGEGYTADKISELYAELFIGNSNLSNLLSFLTSQEEFEKLVLLGMDHPYSLIREETYKFWDDLPEEQALPRVVKGLTDVNEWVRLRSAWAFARRYGTADHLPLLRKQLEHETNKDVQGVLQKAIQRLSNSSDAFQKEKNRP